MKASVITSFDRPPHYGDFRDPAPEGPDEMLVDVLAAGLHRLTRARAAGTHYSGAGGLPVVPGVDGVGRGTDGKLRYFVQGPGRVGTMAEKTVIELDHSIELPDDSDPVAVAGAPQRGEGRAALQGGAGVERGRPARRAHRLHAVTCRRSAREETR